MPRPLTENPIQRRMMYHDHNNRLQSLTAPAADALLAIREITPSHPIGRLQYPWHLSLVRTLEDKGLAIVQWVEYGDEKRQGAWQITDITDTGKALLAQWDERGMGHKIEIKKGN